MEHSLPISFIPNPLDYVLGDGNIPFRGVNASADWSPYIDFYEPQRLQWGDTDACEWFTGLESVDAQINRFIDTGAVSETILTFFHNNGYMDSNSLDGKSHFHSSPRFNHVLSGAGLSGTDMPTVWNNIRAYGVLPYTDLSVTTATEAEYFAPIPQTFKDKAKLFLAMIGGKNSIKYQWVWQDKTKDLTKASLQLQQAPLCLGVAVIDGWNQMIPTDPPVSQVPQHAVMGYAVQETNILIYDHYLPAKKILDAGYPIPYCSQGIVMIPEIVGQEIQMIATQAEQVIPQASSAQANAIMTALQNLIASFLAWWQKP